MSEHLISREDAESDLLACAAYIAESINSGDGHAEAMLTIVPRYLAKGNVDLAAELANTVDDPFTREKLLVRVAEKCAQIDDDEYAAQLVEALEDFGLRAEGFERVGLIKAGKGQFDAARKIASSMPHPDFVYSAIAVKQFADGDREGADKTIAEISFPEARVSAHLNIAHSSFAENAEAAVEHLDLAATDAAEIEHDEEKIRSFVEIGNFFIEAKRNDRAIETFDKARAFAEGLDNVHRDAFFAAVSIGFLRAGSQELSDRALDLVADKTQMATGLLGHARHFWNVELKDDAVESLEESYAILRSQRDAETRNSKDRFGLFTAIAAQFAAFDKGERSIEIAEGIEDESERMSALSQIAAILSLNDADEMARHAVNAIPEDAQRTFALIGMSDAKARNEQKDAAVTLLSEALGLAETVPQLASRTSAYNELAKRFAKLEEADQFDVSVEKLIETMTSIKSETIRVEALTDLASLIDDIGLEIPPEDLDFLKTLLRDVS